MEFRNITPKDKDKIYELYAKQKTLGTEYSAVTLYGWHKNYNLEAAIGDDYVCFRLFYKGKLLYFPPIAQNKARLSELLDELIDMGANEFAEINDYTLTEFCRRNFGIEPDRDMAEYVYLSKSFISLAGKALHPKRNHISQFTNAYKYEFLDYKEEYLEKVVALLDGWIGEKSEQDEVSEYQTEKELILSILNNLDFYNCFADLLVVDGRVIGLSIGEILPTGVGAVFFEKADTNYIGAYSMLSNLFAAKHFEGVTYVNRQEDIGNEGLRRAKLSYRPKYIFMKYVASNKKDSGDRFSDEIIKLYKSAFPEDSDETVNYFFNNIFSPKYVKNIRIGDKLVSALHIVPKTLDYMGSIVKFPFIVGVATDKNHKNMGYASRLMQETLRCMKSQRVPFAMLYPAIKGFYEKFGFEKVFCQSKLNNDLFGWQTVTEAATKDIEKLKELYDNKTAPYQVKIVRDLHQMGIKLGAEDGANLLYISDTLVGYELVTSKGEAVETCLADAYEKTDEPRGMARIINLESAFALLKLSAIYKFRLTDCVFEENNDVYEAQGNTIKHGVGYDFTLSERELCALFFGQTVNGVPKQFIDEFPKKIYVLDKY